jgi:hypothetical protein
VKPATVRYYFDADILGLANVVAGLRSDITYPGDPGAVINKRRRPACAIQPRRPDDEWLPVVAQAEWLIVTRDTNISKHTAEISAVLACGAKLAALASPDACNKWAQLEVLMTRWRDLEKLVDLPGPFVYEVYRTKLTKLA